MPTVGYSPAPPVLFTTGEVCEGRWGELTLLGGKEGSDVGRGGELGRLFRIFAMVFRFSVTTIYNESFV